MVHKLYWGIMLVLLFILPGVSIIMFVLYMVWGFICALFGFGENRQHSQTATEAATDQSQQSVPGPSQVESQKIAEAFAFEAEQLDHERIEEALAVQNAAHHQDAIEQFDQELASWQDQLEADAKR